jgi:hypothetical protein
MSGATSLDTAVLRARALAILEAATADRAVLRLTGGIGVRERARDLGGLDPSRNSATRPIGQ